MFYIKVNIRDDTTPRHIMCSKFCIHVDRIALWVRNNMYKWLYKETIS